MLKAMSGYLNNRKTFQFGIGKQHGWVFFTDSVV